MKPTPRRAENRIAEYLSEEFEHYGLSPVERIPVIGREGPDITINEFGLVIDVKSRKSVPKSYLVSSPVLGYAHALIPLKCLKDNLHYIPKYGAVYSKTVNQWLAHMDKWRQDNYPDGISGVIIRKPVSSLPFGSSVLVIYSHQLEEYQQRWKQLLQQYERLLALP